MADDYEVYSSASKLEYFECGRDVVKVMERMLTESRFTGHFCTSIKADKKSDMKFVDVNARLCAAQVYTPKIFADVTIPLAFFTRFDMLEQHNIQKPSWMVG